MPNPNTFLAFYIADKEVNPKLRFWDKVTCFFDKSPYSHVELAIPRDDGLFDCYSSSVRDGGVRTKPIDLNTGHWQLMPVTIDLNHAMQVFQAEQGKPYDWLGLISTKYYWFPSRSDAWFCSEICACMCGIWDNGNYGVKRLYEWAIVKK